MYINIHKYTYPQHNPQIFSYLLVNLSSNKSISPKANQTVESTVRRKYFSVRTKYWILLLFSFVLCCPLPQFLTLVQTRRLGIPSALSRGRTAHAT